MITTDAMHTVELNDADLVAESLAGNRDAFRRIVERYQTLISSLAYCATGNVSQSEDLAQETFVRAWTQLAQLREPAKLRPWLCSITRFLISKEFRRQGREPIHQAESLDALDEWASPEPLPLDHAISAEEKAILWRSLERIPEIYREPLVLFYREHQSIEAVAHDLDMSEDAVKQRLSRGRKLLQEQLLAFVAGALKQTRPGKTFTIGVIAALPAFATTAKAATAGAAAVKSSAAAKAGLGAVLKTLLNVLLPIGTFVSLGGWLGYKMGDDAGQSARQQKAVARFWAILAACFFVFVLLPLLLWLPLMVLFGSKEHLLAGVRIWLDVMFAVVIGAFAFWIWRRPKLRRQGAAPPLGTTRKLFVWSVALAMIAAGAFLALGLSDTNWKVQFITTAAAQKLIKEKNSDAEFSVSQYQDGHSDLWIKLQEDGKLSKFIAPADKATLALLAEKGIACPVYLQGRDFEVFGWQGKLLMGLCVLVLVAGVGVVLTFSLKNRGNSVMKIGTKAAILVVVVLAAAIVLPIVRHNHQKVNAIRRHTAVPIALTTEVGAQARQAAEAFLEAMKNGDWNSVAAFWPPDAPKGRRFGDLFTDRMKNQVNGLEIVSLGTPYKEGPNSWILVPYEVQFKSGGAHTNSLRLGQDSQGHWHWEGGF